MIAKFGNLCKMQICVKLTHTHYIVAETTNPDIVEKFEIQINFANNKKQTEGG